LVIDGDFNVNEHILQRLRSIQIRNSDQEKTLAFFSDDQLPIVNLQLLQKPESKCHKHIVIAISGFLSEKSDQTEDWAHLKSECKKFGYPLICVKWESQSAVELGYFMLDRDSYISRYSQEIN